MRGRAPVLVFAGTVPYTQDGELPGSRTEFIQWIQDVRDQRGILRNYVKYDNELRTGRNVKQLVHRALQIARSEPAGPVYLTGAREVMEERIEPYQVDPAQLPAGRPGRADRGGHRRDRDRAGRRQAPADRDVLPRTRPRRGPVAGRAGRPAGHPGARGDGLSRQLPRRPPAARGLPVPQHRAESRPGRGRRDPGARLRRPVDPLGQPARPPTPRSTTSTSTRSSPRCSSGTCPPGGSPPRTRRSRWSRSPPSSGSTTWSTTRW